MRIKYNFSLFELHLISVWDFLSIKLALGAPASAIVIRNRQAMIEYIFAQN